MSDSFYMAVFNDQYPIGEILIAFVFFLSSRIIQKMENFGSKYF
jgi:hypothetical protein